MLDVGFWFDPICPFAWLASRWLLLVEPERSLTVKWNVMSLSVLNENREKTPEYADLMERAWGPVRVATAARLELGPSALLPLYNAYGRLIHEQKLTVTQALDPIALERAGLPAGLASAAMSGTYDEELRRGHADGMDPVGYDVGTPVIHVKGSAFFGPVFSRVPSRDDALSIWDGIQSIVTYPYFYELKRSRVEAPVIPVSDSPLAEAGDSR